MDPMQLGRVSILILWLAGLASVVVPALRGVGALVALIGVVHVIEFAIFARALRDAGGSMAEHFWKTLLYGMLHIVPTRRAAGQL